MNIDLLSLLWYSVFIIAIIGYATLDGFDLGVGILHPFVKSDYEKRVFINAIGPVWDGNAVWLVVILGALLAGFPYAYATLLSAYYTPVMVFIAGLILRAVAIEFRSKQASKMWRNSWDWLFAIASFTIAFGAGVFIGNLVEGIALDDQQVYRGDFFDFFTPYSLIVGITTVACFAMHGCIFLIMKTERELHQKLRNWVRPLIIFFIISYAITTFATLIWQPHMLTKIQEKPYLFIFVLLSLLAIANIPREIHKGNDGRAFLSSAVSIAFLIVLYGIGMFPTLVRSSLGEANSLTVFNSDSSELTLTILLCIVAIGIPLVILYGFIIARVFRGKVRIDDHSY
jgi:cytochrome d ubiquinol oxidase subunit II